MSRLTVFIWVFALAACGAPPTPGSHDGGDVRTDGGLDLNDVSFLFPLPASPALESQLLGLDALLSPALYAGLPVIIEGRDAGELYTALRVVSARIDPCFPTTAPPAPAACAKQLRLVAQPLALDSALGLTTEDATVHLFYDLSPQQFDAAMRTVLELRAQAGGLTDGQPLDIHPVMRAQGLSGAYAQKLKAMISAHCTSQTLVRIAFMHVAATGSAWRFGAFDVVAGQLVAAKIPRTPDLTVQGVQEFGSTEFRSGQLVPAASGDQLPVLLSESSMRLTDEKTLQKALKSALTIENPERSTPQTIDCASCHVASRARTNAERRRMVDTTGYDEAYLAPARFDVRRVDAVGEDPKALRAFGYVGGRGAWSQRTVNESAAIAEALSRSGPR